MFYLNIPTIQNLKKELDEKYPNQNLLTIPGFSVKSSIWEPCPKATLTYSSSYFTPDILGLYVGTELRVQYKISPTGTEIGELKTVSQLDDHPDKEEASRWLTLLQEDVVDNSVDKAWLDRKSFRFSFPETVVKDIEMKSEGNTPETTVYCVGAFDFYQNSKKRKCYKNMYGNDILTDILNENPTTQEGNVDEDISRFKRALEKTNNVTTAYRSLGEEDWEFIRDSLIPDFSIGNSKPLFYIGLDRTIHFTSLTKLMDENRKCDFVVNLGGNIDNGASKMIEDLRKNYVTPSMELPSLLKDGNNFIKNTCYDTITTQKYKIHIGGTAAKNLKNVTYFSRFDSRVLQTNRLEVYPAAEKKTYYPVNKNLLNFIDNTQSNILYNRPAKNIRFESKNSFQPFEDLITIKVVVNDLNSLRHLISAGMKALVFLPYTYSIFNGAYLVSEIKYGFVAGQSQIEVELIRPNLDLSFIDYLKDLKTDDKVSFKYSPIPDTTNLYRV